MCFNVPKVRSIAGSADHSLHKAAHKKCVISFNRQSCNWPI
jgi:hypothetical protein